MIDSQIIDMVDMGIIILDRELNITDWNKWVEYRSDFSSQEVMGNKITALFDNLDVPWFHNNCRSVLKFGNYAFFSQKLHHYCIPMKAEGRFRSQFQHMQQNCTLGPLRDEKRRIVGLFLMISDVTEITHYEAVLTEMAHTDGLTGIWNRQYFDKRLKEECARNQRFKRNMSIIMFDVDHFKEVNDTLGHQYGDFVLKEMTNLVKSRVRDIDLLARYGGEEFIILLPETALKQGLHLAEVLREMVESHQFIHNGNSMAVTASFGVSATCNDTCVLEELIKEADDSMYLSKKRGRNCVSSIVSQGE